MRRQISINGHPATLTVSDHCPNCHGLMINGICHDCHYAVVCARCKQVRQADRSWKEVAWRGRIDTNTSHGMCIPCTRVVYGDQLVDRMLAKRVGASA